MPSTMSKAWGWKIWDWLSDKILGHFWIYGPKGRVCILCQKEERS